MSAQSDHSAAVKSVLSEELCISWQKHDFFFNWNL